MTKFKPKKQVSHGGSKRSSYHAARIRRQAMWRRIRVGIGITLAAAVVFTVSNTLPSAANDTRPITTGPTTTSKQPSNPLKAKKLYVDPDSNAARQAVEWRTTQPAKALLMNKLADQPNARWFSNEITYDLVHGYIAGGQNQGAIPVTVAYYLPKRDCTKYSSGGAASEALYYDYIDTYAKAIGNLEAVVILEPDALVHTVSTSPQGSPCLTDGERDMYYTLLSYAVDRFKSLPATIVYIDAGNSGWTEDAAQMADLLKRVNVEKADGFALNVSNFQTTEDTIAFGNAISAKTGDKRYVIDTSRNGLGPYVNQANPAYNWCNPPGRALGHYPTVATGMERVDAFLYIKNIGESDGTDADAGKCFNGPAAGVWWPDYAAGLVERWPVALQYSYKP